MPADIELRYEMGDAEAASIIRHVFCETVDEWVEDYIGILRTVQDQGVEAENKQADRASVLRGFAVWVKGTVDV